MSCADQERLKRDYEIRRAYVESRLQRSVLFTGDAFTEEMEVIRQIQLECEVVREALERHQREHACGEG